MSQKYEDQLQEKTSWLTTGQHDNQRELALPKGAIILRCTIRNAMKDLGTEDAQRESTGDGQERHVKGNLSTGGQQAKRERASAKAKANAESKANAKARTTAAQIGRKASTK